MFKGCWPNAGGTREYAWACRRARAWRFCKVRARMRSSPAGDDTRIGRHIVLDVKADSAAAAELSVKAMCDKLLANPVTEDYRIASTVTA